MKKSAGSGSLYPLSMIVLDGLIFRIDTDLAVKIKGKMLLTSREVMAMFHRCCVSMFTLRQVLERLGKEPFDEA
jgi:hypothetical protein